MTIELLRKLSPLTLVTVGPGLDTILSRSEQYPENCTVAPSNESSRLPARPAPSPTTSTGHCAANLAASSSRPVATGTSSPPIQNAAPTARPPAPDAKRPRGVTPPLVPGLTVFETSVMSLGGVRDNTPSSLPHVSPQQHA